MKFCSKCGKPINQGAVYCPNCGAKISKQNDLKDSKKKQPKLWGCLGFLILFILLLFILSSCQNSSDKKDERGYSAKIVKSTPDDGQWNISGKTNAPDGFIVAATLNGDDDSQNQIGSDSTTPVKVKNHKFSGQLDSISAQVDKNNTPTFTIAAIPSDRISKDNFLKKDGIKLITKVGSKFSEDVTESQISYFKSLGNRKQKKGSSNPLSSASSQSSIPSDYTNAFKAAQDYMEDGQGFSKQGLQKQLTSKYGDGFSQNAANYAVNKFTEEDYDKQAVIAAKEYKDDQHMSPQELKDQLTAEAGSGFTESEAQYALNKLNY